MTPKFEYFQGKDNQWYFHLKARNGEIICQSEGYTTKDSALNGIRSVQNNASTAEVVEIKKT